MKHNEPLARPTVSILEAASLLSISRASVYRLLRDGSITAIKWSRRTLVERSSIDAFLADQPVARFGERRAA